MTSHQSGSVRTGLWYDDLYRGLIVEHAVSRTVTETDNVLFSTMTMNPQPLHIDRHFASKTEFGAPIVNSMFTAALVVGIAVPELTLGTTIANLGFREIDFPHPVFHGDTLRVVTEVLETRASKSRPEAGIAVFEHRGMNQDALLVCRAVRVAMMHRKSTG